MRARAVEFDGKDGDDREDVVGEGGCGGLGCGVIEHGDLDPEQ
jgi:hypothetical protein